MSQEAPQKAGNEQSTDRLGTMRIGKLLLEFSIPAIISMVFNSLYNVVDTAFLGHAVGDMGVAVTTLALPIMIILMGFSMLAGQGGSALAAIQLGEGRRDAAEKTMGNTATLLIVIAVVVGVSAAIFIDPLLAMVGTPADLWAPTKAFVQIICFGFIFQSLGMGLNNFLRTAGQPRLALYTMVLGTTMCIILNYFFVLIFGWGVEGSAFATIIGQACGMLPIIWYFVFNKKAVFHLRTSCMIPDFRLMGRILSLGLASFVMQVGATAVTVVLNHLLAIYGAQDAIGAEGALAAIGAANKAITFAIMPVVGLIMGSQPLIGYNYGAKNWQRVLDTLKLASIWATVLMTFFWVLVHVIPGPIIGVFGISGNLEDFAITVLKLDTLVLPIVGFQIVGSSYFQSSGQPFKSAILEMSRQVIYLIPLYIIFPMVLPYFGITPLVAIVLAVPSADFLACVTTVFFVRQEVKKVRRWRDEAAKDTTKVLA